MLAHVDETEQEHPISTCATGEQGVRTRQGFQNLKTGPYCIDSDRGCMHGVLPTTPLSREPEPPRDPTVRKVSLCNIFHMIQVDLHKIKYWPATGGIHEGV